MRARRTLIAFAVVCALAAGVTALTQSQGKPSPQPPPATAAPAVPAPVRIHFGPAGSASFTQVVPLNAHVIIEVSVSGPAQVTLDGLGQIQAAEPNTAASFDLFTGTALSTPVSVIAPDGSTQTIGTLVIAQNR